MQNPKGKKRKGRKVRGGGDGVGVFKTMTAAIDLVRTAGSIEAAKAALATVEQIGEAVGRGWPPPTRTHSRCTPVTPSNRQRQSAAVAKHTRIATAFLIDLDVVHPKGADGKRSLNFEPDLELAYQHARANSRQQNVSANDLTSLAEAFDVWRRDRQHLLQQSLGLLHRDDPLRSPVSLFGTMDYGRLETAHTRALAWLLDERQQHGFGRQLLEALLAHMLKGRQIRVTRVNNVTSEFRVPSGPKGVDTGRIDVLAEGYWEENGKESSWMLGSEAKIDAQEGNEQLSSYDDWLDARSHSSEVLRVFLTPEGRSARTGEREWKVLSFLSLAAVLRKVSGVEDQAGYHFLRYYLTGVLRDICRVPVPITSDCQNPYAALAYLQEVLSIGAKAD